MAETEAGQRRSAGLGRLIQAICLVYAAFVIVEDVQQTLWTWPSPLTAQAGTIGARYDDPAGGFVVVGKLNPGGALADAGVVAGDRVRFDRFYDFFRRLKVGEPVGFTLLHGGRSSHHLVVARARTPKPHTALDRLGLLYNLATTLAALFGAFIVWRSRGNTTTILLGMALLTYGMISTEPQMLVSDPSVAPVFIALGGANLVSIPVLFYAFAVGFYRDHVGPARPFEKPAFWSYALVMALLGAATIVEALTGMATPVMDDAIPAIIVGTYVGFAICLIYLVLGWRRSAAAVQQRYALMLVATCAILAAQALDVLSGQATSDTFATVHFIANSLLTGVIASGLFAYSILRHKVFDLGFAVNRTLVYGVVSAILLAAFGLIEWGVDHVVPIQGREKNALIDAAIAVCVFLTFHRVRDLVEHVIEGMFFRRWQKAEAELRRFVREAAFITEAAALSKAFVAALSRFGDGTRPAIYMLDKGDYALAQGEAAGVPHRLGANLPAMVSLRADPKPMEIHDGVLAGSLIAPMVNRNEVVGFVVLGPKPDGLTYRPDEIDLIGWATQQIGQDLHALEVERFSALAAELRQENATLRSLIPQHA